MVAVRETLSLVAVLCILGYGSCVEQSVVDYIAKYVTTRYDVITNLDGYQVRVTMRNTGTSPVNRGDWKIFFTHIRFIERQRLAHNENGIEIGEFRIKHVNGLLYWMTAGSNFTTMAANQEKSVVFRCNLFTVSYTDVMPNWYVTSDGRETRTIVNTAGTDPAFVGPINTPAQWKRYSSDKYDPYTPLQRYGLNQARDMKRAPKRVIPEPFSDRLNDNGRKVNLGTGDWVIVAQERLRNEVEFLIGELNVPVTNTAPAGRYVELRIGAVPNTNNSQEAYSIVVDPVAPKITLTSPTTAGVFYGVQTMLALLATSWEIPEGTIVDFPRFSWRGQHYDNSRNFQGKENIFTLLDAMAMYKMNRLHFHVTDDEGWRVEIPGLEELTEIAGYRCHDLNETRCLIPQLGSGPTTGTSGSGFLTREEYREVLRYAKRRYIQVIPEFDMPGHGHAAIKAMHARYLKYRDTNMTAATEYLLDELDDTTRYMSVQFFTDNAINPCINSTYNFIAKVAEEAVKMHQDIQPLTIFHFGGDEVARDAWTNSSACQNLVATDPDITDRHTIKRHFVKRLAQTIQHHGLTVAGWEDGLFGGGDRPFNLTFLPRGDYQANAWSNVWEWGNGKRAYVFANAGYKVVISHATHLYFDMPYEPDPEERGYYWATRFVSTKKTFGFIPDSIYDNIRNKLNGDNYTKEEHCARPANCPPLKRRENILGIQGQLWSETVRTVDQLFYMIFPRMVALAERAWHKASWEDIADRNQRDRRMHEDWEAFANTLGYRELARLDRMGIKYRVPPPGARISGRTLSANSDFPGLTLRYSTNDGTTWTDLPGSIQLSPGARYMIATWSADGSRRSRHIVLTAARVSKGHGSRSSWYTGIAAIFVVWACTKQ